MLEAAGLYTSRSQIGITNRAGPDFEG
jgi:hypothetical protein